MKDILDATAMLALGFTPVPANEAKKRDPMINADGDEVWIHSYHTELWVQGFPSGSSLFKAIYKLGVCNGECRKSEQIRLALGV